MKTPTEKSATLRSEDVYNILKEKLISSEFRPGSALMEQEMAEEMQVSRTPVRQALSRLERDGLVEIIPRKGAFVKSHSLKDIVEIFQIRKSLEAYAANLAAADIDLDELDEYKQFYLKASKMNDGEHLQEFYDKGIEFHKFIIRSAKNSRIEKILAELRVQFEISRIVFLNQNRNRNNIALERAYRMIENHLIIIEALRNKDGETAEKYMREHIIDAEKSLLSFPASAEYVR